jgi:hypothetical protein
VLGALAPTTAPVALAAGDLRIDVDSTYRIDANDGVVRVRLDATLTNLKGNTTRRTPTGTIVTRYWYDRIFFWIQRDARSVKATSGGSTLRTSLDTKARHRELSIRIPNLYFRQTRKIRIEFDLPGGKPRSESDIRVGEAFATFTAWAQGDPGRSSVRIVMPAGFTNTGYGRTLKAAKDDGRTVLSSGTISDPNGWYAVIVADRPGALTDIRVGPATEPIVIRAWPEDTAWREQVSTVLEDGLPILKDLIGMDWPVVDELTVTEVHTPLLEGYAGIYDSSVDEIRISEDLDAQTILHEASHAWFDHAFIDERWVLEGLAEEYAARVRSELDLEGEAAPPTLDPTAEVAFPLAFWPPLGRITEEETLAQEHYGYGASWTVMREIAKDVGDEGMRQIFKTIADREIGYVGDGPAETSGARLDWRQFLDLVEEIGGAEGADDLFLKWVAPVSAQAAIKQRAAARESYDALETAGDGWSVPHIVRGHMWSWSFRDATEAMATATALIEQREALEAVSSELGVQPPDDLEARYEAATIAEQLTGVERALEARIATAEELIRTRTALAAERTPIVALGLAGEVPAAGFDRGLAAFTRGELDAAKSAAAESMALLAEAESIGGSRALAIGASMLALIVLLVVVAVLLRRRGRRRLAALSVATPVAAAGVTDASSTLAATPDPATEASVPVAPTITPPLGDEPD